MIRLCTSILILLLLAMPAWAATRTFTNGGVDDFASTAGNWDTPPANDDAIVIAAGSSCCWDVDTSGWAAGVAGLTITSHATTPATLYFKTSGTTNYLKIKTGTTINGTNAAVKGRLVINSDGAFATTTVYPAAAKATIQFVTTGFLDGTYLDLRIRCAEPTNRVIMMTATEPAAETVLAVDTDVSADWAVGDLISICNSQSGSNQETREIASMTASTITITTGLTATKTYAAGQEPRILLVTRNVKIIGGAGATQKCIANLSGTGQVVNAWVCPTTAGQGYGFDNCTGLVITGGYTGAAAIGQGVTGFARGWSSCTGTWSTSTASGNANGWLSCNGTWATSTASGNSQGWYICNGTWVTSTASGNAIGWYTCNGTWSTCTASGNNHGWNICNGTWATSTASGNAAGWYTCNGIWATSTASGNSRAWDNCTGTWATLTCNNTIEFLNCPFAKLRNATLSGATENNGYNTTAVPDNSIWISKDHGGVAGAEKTMTPGGITLTSTTSPPPGYTVWRQITLESATRYGFHQDELTIMPGETLRVRGVMRIDADQSSYAPRLQIVSQSADPLVIASNTPLATMSIPVADGTETGWQSVEVSYKNTATIPLMVFVRVIGRHATENVDFAYTDRSATRLIPINMQGGFR